MLDSVDGKNTACERFHAERELAESGVLPPADQVESVPDDQFRAECLELLGKTDILPPALLEDMLTEIEMSDWNDLWKRLPEGGKCCLSVIPFYDNGKPLSSYDVEEKRYLRLLYVSAKDGLTRYFAPYPYAAHYFELLPEFIRRNCTFDAPMMPNEKDPIGFQGQQKFIADSTAAFNKLREFFGQKPIKPEERGAA